MRIAADKSILGITLLFAMLAQAYADKALASGAADLATEVQSKGDHSERIRTVDHSVPHTSTVPNHEGEPVELFVRERFFDFATATINPAVLFVHGSSLSTVPVFDLRFENYSWMAFLAEAGFDTFAMDLTGYGLSPRPEMDGACNASFSDQIAHLIPNPLPGPCAPFCPFRLTTSQSDWDEIDTVVDYIRQLRGVDKVNLIGHSLGGPRMGGYAARHPEKVDKLFLYAPAYNRLEPSDPPAVLPQRGVPLGIQTVQAVFDAWDRGAMCENEFEPAIREVLRSTILEFDPLGRTWGTEDLWRFPVQNTRWGWNRAFASQIEAPTLLIRGDLDTTVPEADVRALFADLVTEQKVFVHVACGLHIFVWENQHMALLRASEEWLSHGTFAGHTNGSFFVDADGHIHEE